jgi:hypothetical protein
LSAFTAIKEFKTLPLREEFVFSESEINVYPNPVANGNPIHVVSTSSSIKEIIIFNLLGQEVYSVIFLTNHRIGL